MKCSNLLLCLPFMFMSCSKDSGVEPVACFEGSTSVDVFQNVNFQDCSEDADDYDWNFEDGGTGETSSLKSPSFSWNKSGSFTVSLKVKNGSKKDEISKTVFVKDFCNYCEKEVPNGPSGDTYTVYENFCTDDFSSKEDYDAYYKYVTASGYSCKR